MERQRRNLCVMLFVTNSCNLHCRYCFEHHKNAKVMNLETGKKIISDIFKNDDDIALKVDFFGGEPFLNFNLIQDLCEWCWINYPKKNIKFFTTTNGTLFTKDVKTWLSKNKEKFTASLSLDGTPEMQMINRGTVISQETIDFVRKLWPFQGVNMTISQETLTNLAEGVIYIHRLGFKTFKVSLARGPQWKLEEAAIYERELEKLISFYVTHPDIIPCDFFHQNIKSVLSEQMLTYHCGAGKTMRAYDTEGNSYPCHFFTSSPINTINGRKLSYQDLDSNKFFLNDPECQNCIVRNLCKTCVGQNFVERKCVGKRDKTLCPFILIENVFIARYKLYLLSNKDIDDLDKNDYLELKAADKLIKQYNSLKNIVN